MTKFKVGDRVKPLGWTKDHLTYGFIKAIDCNYAYVYWPEIKSNGRWDIDAIELKPRAAR